MKFNFYSTLGLKPNATIPEIKKAYRKLAMENHPDIRPNDKFAAKKMLEANEAYEILSNPDKKNKYDIDLLSYLKREMEKEKAQANRTEHRSESNTKEATRAEPESVTIEEKIIEAGKSVLASVLRFVLRR